MSAFSWPLLVSTSAQDRFDLVLDLPGPTRFRAVLPMIWERTGLPVGTPLFLGATPVDPLAEIGRPPLLAGIVLTSRPRPRGAADWSVDVLTGPSGGSTVPLDRPLLVGRSVRADIPVGDPYLSRRHARILPGDQPEVQDLESGNGTWAEGRRRRRVPVGERTTLRFGDTLIQVRPSVTPGLHTVPDGRGRLLVNRPPRLERSEPITLPPAPREPEAQRRRPVPVIAAVTGLLLGVTIALVTRMWMFLLLATLGPVMMMVTAVADRVTGRRAGRRARREHARAWAADLDAVDRALEQDRRISWDERPGPGEAVELAEEIGRGLWAADAADRDRWHVMLAAGERDARIGRSDPPRIEDVPLAVDLDRVGVLGLVGEPCRAVLRAVVIQLLVRHPPSELRLALVSGDQQLTDSLRRVPHQHSGAARRQLLVLDDPMRGRDLPQVREFLAAAGPGGPLVICWAPTTGELPVECRAVVTGDAVLRIEVPTGDDPAIPVGDATDDGLPVTAGSDLFDRCCRALGRLIDPDLSDQAVPQQVLRSDLDPWPTTAAALRQTWRESGVRSCLGVGATGQVVIDLERDGPHLLVAGTTGAGKSELLRTLVVGLTVAAPPTRTSLLLIDYKGGAAFADLLELPHIVGCVTDLEPRLAERALTSLRAALRSREEQLRDGGLADLAQWRSRPDLGPAPPSLVIVVDEFATLAADLPRFLAGLLDVAQRGRSLGVHLVLATQRPAGVVSAPMKANITARLCLRVADPADSLDLVDVPDAALLSADRPGRVLWRTGRGRTELLQTAQVGVPPRDRIILREAGSAAPPIERGRRTDLDDLVALVREVSTDLPAVAPPWLPPLPERIEAADLADARFAVLDRPAEAEQLEVGLPAGSVLLAGPPGSGRRTTADRLLQLWLRRGAEVHLVGATRPLLPATLPAVGSAVDAGDPHLIARLVQLLHTRLQERLGGRGDSRPVVLRIDDWEAVTTALELVDLGVTPGRLADLVGRGPAAGIRVIGVADTRTLHHRIAGQFTDSMHLGGDGFAPGGGRWNGDDVRIVLPADDTDHPDSLPAVTRVAALPLTAVPRSGVGGPDLVALGLGGDAADVIGLDPSTWVGGFLVAGPRRSGVSTTLAVLARGAVTAGIPVLHLVGTAPDRATLGHRVPLADGGAALEDLLVAHEGPILLVADEPDDQGRAAELLSRFLTVAGPGQLLAIGCRLDRALRAHRGLITDTAAHRTGVLLQANASEGGLLDVSLPRRRDRPGVGRGHLVRLGTAEPIQIFAP